MVEYLKIMHRNYLGYLMLPIIALAFAFDHAISSLMYLVGYDPHGISYLPFVSEQYRYLKDVKNVVGLNAEPFHVFELFIWLAAIVSILKIGMGISFFRHVDRDRSRWKQLGLTGSGVSALGYLVMGVMGLLIAIIIQQSSGPLLMQQLLSYSPKSFVGWETYVFFGSSVLIADSILSFFLALKFGSTRAPSAPPRGSGDPV